MGRMGSVALLGMIGLSALVGCKADRGDKSQTKRDKDRMEIRMDDLRSQNERLIAENAQLKAQIELLKKSK